MSYWWMSFCDAEKPKGSQFLGVLIIKANNVRQAIHRSWELELNPGGEIMAQLIPEECEKQIPVEWIETRLINKKEYDEWDGVI